MSNSGGPLTLLLKRLILEAIDKIYLRSIIRKRAIIIPATHLWGLFPSRLVFHQSQGLSFDLIVRRNARNQL